MPSHLPITFFFHNKEEVWCHVHPCVLELLINGLVQKAACEACDLWAEWHGEVSKRLLLGSLLFCEVLSPSSRHFCLPPPPYLPVLWSECQMEKKSLMLWGRRGELLLDLSEKSMVTAQTVTQDITSLVIEVTNAGIWIAIIPDSGNYFSVKFIIYIEKSTMNEAMCSQFSDCFG